MQATRRLQRRKASSSAGSNLPLYGNLSTRRRKLSLFTTGIDLRRMRGHRLPISPRLPSALSSFLWAFKRIFFWSIFVSLRSTSSSTSERHWTSRGHASKQTSSFLSSTPTKTSKTRSSFSTTSMKSAALITSLNSSKRASTICSCWMLELRASDRRFLRGYKGRRCRNSRRRRRSRSSRRPGLIEDQSISASSNLYCFR